MHVFLSQHLALKAISLNDRMRKKQKGIKGKVFFCFSIWTMKNCLRSVAAKCLFGFFCDIPRTNNVREANATQKKRK